MTLTQRFAAGALGHSLRAQLDAALAAFARGNVASGNAALSAYQQEVAAQSGKTLTAAAAARLVQFAEALKR